MRFFLISLTGLALWTGAAFAQGAPNGAAMPDPVTTKPGPSVSVTKTQRIIDGRGVETDRVETLDKSQSFDSGNGELRAKTTTQSTEKSQVTTPPTVTIRKSTTTTSETDR